MRGSPDVLVDETSDGRNIWDDPSDVAVPLPTRVGDRFVMQAELSNSMCGPWVVVGEEPRPVSPFQPPGGRVLFVRRPGQVERR